MTTLTYQERFKTLSGVFDEFTNRNLFELQSRGFFNELMSPIFVGKESNVFLADSKNKKVIVKIYRMQNRDFKRMFNYIKQDPRYDFLKNKNRDVILAWTQREYKNLLKAAKAKVCCPEPLAIKNNVIVESLIGKDKPARQLKDQIPENPKTFLSKIIKEIKKLYSAGVVHGDVSAFNVLNYQEKPHLIDFSQATLTKTSGANELLRRDLNNLLLFFKKLNIEEDLEEIFKSVVEK